MIVTVQETHFTFEVKSEAEPVRSAAVDDMVTSCLATSFNEIHDPTEYHVESIEVESEDVTPVSIHGVESGAGFPRKLHSFLALVLASHHLTSHHSSRLNNNSFFLEILGIFDVRPLPLLLARAFINPQLPRLGERFLHLPPRIVRRDSRHGFSVSH